MANYVCMYENPLVWSQSDFPYLQYCAGLNYPRVGEKITSNPNERFEWIFNIKFTVTSFAKKKLRSRRPQRYYFQSIFETWNRNQSLRKLKHFSLDCGDRIITVLQHQLWFYKILRTFKLTFIEENISLTWLFSQNNDPKYILKRNKK